MVKTIEEGFREFHGRLTPTVTESEAAKRHRESIKSCLESNFGVTNFFRSGSFGNGTSIRGYSDVDYFAVIPRENLSNDSSYTLRKVKEALDNRFPNTGVMVRTPAVVVPFGKDALETTEIVPADYLRKNDYGYNIYDIPDYEGGWMKSSPSAYAKWLTDINETLSNKVKPLVRFLKAWKYYLNVPILSFYLEVKITKYAAGENSIVYSIDIRRILNELNNNLSAIRDPLGISGNIIPCTTEYKKEDAISKLNTALSRANNAIEEERKDNIKDAFDWWNILTDYNFPSYY
jgi:hypothetical protein